jgi:hypothetical protein
MLILRGLSSKILQCGCLAGVYETYNGEVVGILDARSATCTIAAHQNGKQLPAFSTPARAESRGAASDSKGRASGG